MKQFLSFLSVTFGLFALAQPAQAFTCKQINQFTELYLRLHYSAEVFDDEISERAFGHFLKTLDPAKMYFLKEEVQFFRDNFETRLDDFMQREDCRALDQILQSYSNRYKTRQPKIIALIDAEHDFTVDETYNVDRKIREWAADEDALNERWRKQVKLELLRLKERYDDLDKAREKLKKRYQLNQKYLFELDALELASIFLNAYSSSLDPHTKYLSPETLEDFHISTSLSLEGIGAVLRSEYGMTTIQSLVAGGPAKKSGQLKVGDTIVAAAQVGGEPVDLVDMKLRDVVKLIRGDKGSEVILTVEREEKDKIETHTVSIIRDKIELNDKAARGFSYDVEVTDPESAEVKMHKIGLIQLPSFYTDFEARKQQKVDFKSSAADMKRLINELKDEGIDGLIVDLRFNSGGSLDEAVNIAGLFFDSGPVVQVRHTDGSKQVLADKDGVTYYDGPLVVMINRQSASSSEILAGAIQDYKRGLIVGDSHSFGKGTVQTVREIHNGEFGAVKVTISQFFRPGGQSTQLKGVESDIVFPDLVDELKIGEKFHDHHLPWNEIESSNFTFVDTLQDYVPQLAEASRLRVEQDDDFKKVLEDIAEYHEKKDSRSEISLLEESEEEAEDNAEEGESSVAENEENTESSESAEEEAVVAEAEIEEEEDDRRPALDKDIHLRETLGVVADYLSLIEGKPLGQIAYPELKEVVVAEADFISETE